MPASCGSPKSLAVWDNRLVQHRAIHDYGEQRRVLYRVTIAEQGASTPTV